MRGRVGIRPGALIPALSGALALMLVLAPAGPVGAHADDGAEYEIRPGETLSEIAFRLAVEVQTLIAVNSITDPDRIFAGRNLKLPGDQSSPPSGGSAPDTEAYVVQPGETLSEIAARFGVPASDLAAANGIDDRNLVWAGSRLRIATEVPAAPDPATQSTHVVQPGETLSEVAARFGVSTSDLAAANGIENVDFVAAGTSLSVPGAWRCPTPDVQHFVDDFEIRKPDGRFHDGVDLFAPRGSPVVAPVGGVVEQITGSRGGLQFELRGDDGHVYIGTHLDSFGESGRVSPGSVLGTVGDSGNAKGSDPHLHFEIHPNDGPPANPYPVLVEACPT